MRSYQPWQPSSSSKLEMPARIAIGTSGGPWLRASHLFQFLRARGINDPVEQVLRPIRSGELTAWLGNDADAATVWAPIEARLFVLGMTIHSSGMFTKGNVPMEEY